MDYIVDYVQKGTEYDRLFYMKSEGEDPNGSHATNSNREVK